MAGYELECEGEHHAKNKSLLQTEYEKAKRAIPGSLVNEACNWMVTRPGKGRRTHNRIKSRRKGDPDQFAYLNMSGGSIRRTVGVEGRGSHVKVVPILDVTKMHRFLASDLVHGRRWVTGSDEKVLALSERGNADQEVSPIIVDVDYYSDRPRALDVKAMEDFVQQVVVPSLQAALPKDAWPFPHAPTFVIGTNAEPVGDDQSLEVRDKQSSFWRCAGCGGKAITTPGGHLECLTCAMRWCAAECAAAGAAMTVTLSGVPAHCRDLRVVSLEHAKPSVGATGYVDCKRVLLRGTVTADGGFEVADGQLVPQGCLFGVEATKVCAQTPKMACVGDDCYENAQYTHGGCVYCANCIKKIKLEDPTRLPTCKNYAVGRLKDDDTLACRACGMGTFDKSLDDQTLGLLKYLLVGALDFSTDGFAKTLPGCVLRPKSGEDATKVYAEVAVAAPLYAYATRVGQPPTRVVRVGLPKALVGALAPGSDLKYFTAAGSGPADVVAVDAPGAYPTQVQDQDRGREWVAPPPDQAAGAAPTRVHRYKTGFHVRGVNNTADAVGPFKPPLRPGDCAYDLKGRIVGVVLAPNRIRVLPDPGADFEKYNPLKYHPSSPTEIVCRGPARGDRESRHLIAGRVRHDARLVVGDSVMLTKAQQLRLRAKMVAVATNAGLWCIDSAEQWEELLDESVLNKAALRPFHCSKVEKCPYCHGKLATYEKICRGMGWCVNGKVEGTSKYRVASVLDARGSPLPRIARGLQLHRAKDKPAQVNRLTRILKLTSVMVEIPRHAPNCTNATIDPAGCAPDCPHKGAAKNRAFVTPAAGFRLEGIAADCSEPPRDGGTALCHNLPLTRETEAGTRGNRRHAAYARQGARKCAKEILFGRRVLTPKGKRLVAWFVGWVRTLGEPCWASDLVVYELSQVRSKSTYEYWFNTNSTRCRIAGRCHNSNTIWFRLFADRGNPRAPWIYRVHQRCFDADCARKVRDVPKAAWRSRSVSWSFVVSGAVMVETAFRGLARRTTAPVPPPSTLGASTATALKANATWLAGIVAKRREALGQDNSTSQAVWRDFEPIFAGSQRRLKQLRAKRDTPSAIVELYPERPVTRPPHKRRRLQICTTVPVKDSRDEVVHMMNLYEALGLNPAKHIGVWRPFLLRDGDDAVEDVLKGAQDRKLPFKGVYVPALTGRRGVSAAAAVECWCDGLAKDDPFTERLADHQTALGECVDVPGCGYAVVTKRWVIGPPTTATEWSWSREEPDEETGTDVHWTTEDKPDAACEPAEDPDEGIQLPAGSGDWCCVVRIHVDRAAVDADVWTGQHKKIVPLHSTRSANGRIHWPKGIPVRVVKVYRGRAGTHVRLKPTRIGTADQATLAWARLRLPPENRDYNKFLRRICRGVQCQRARDLRQRHATLLKTIAKDGDETGYARRSACALACKRLTSASDADLLKWYRDLWKSLASSKKANTENAKAKATWGLAMHTVELCDRMRSGTE